MTDLTDVVLDAADYLGVPAACINNHIAEVIAEAVERRVRDTIANDIEARATTFKVRPDRYGISDNSDYWEGWFYGTEDAARIARGGAA